MDDRQNESGIRQRHLGSGIALGVAIGVSFGVAFGNLALGIGLGIALGAAYGSYTGKKRDDAAPKSSQVTDEHDD